MVRISPAPEWMQAAPEPVQEWRKLSGSEIGGYSGRVRLDSIRYYPENRRTDRQVKLLERQMNVTPSNDQLVDELIDDPELEIERLARNILENGQRVPIILSNDGRLLDGNRRYLAHRWIEREGTPQQKEQFSNVDAWVLAAEYSNSYAETRVISEYNFLDDFKKDWTDYVRARFLWEQRYEADLSIPELVKLYGGPGFSRSKITELINTYDVILEYGDYLKDEDAAQAEGADHFVWFQQLYRSYRQWMSEDEEFQNAVFSNIRDGGIVKTDQLKNLKEMRNYKDAWQMFRRGDVDEAQHLTRGYRLDEQKRLEPNTLMGQVITNLNRLIDGNLVDGISEENRAEFHLLSIQMPGQIDNLQMRVDYLVSQLQALKSIELRTLDESRVAALENEVANVVKQARSTRGL